MNHTGTILETTPIVPDQVEMASINLPPFKTTNVYLIIISIIFPPEVVNLVRGVTSRQ